MMPGYIPIENVIDFLLFQIQNRQYFSVSNIFSINTAVIFGLAVLFSSLLLSIVFMPFLGLYGNFSIGLIGLTAITACLLSLFNTVLFNGSTSSITLFHWFSLNAGLHISFTLYIDHISYSFALLTAVIALFTHVYAFAYFRYEPNIDRLLLMLLAFVTSMLILVLAGNLIVLFLG